MIKEEFKPYPHQEDMANTILRNNGRALIAASVGSGKTFGVLYGLEKLREAGRAKNVLVVVPASLRENFLKNIRKFTTGHTVYSWVPGKGPTLQISGDPDKGLNFTIVSYSLFRQDPDRYLTLPNGEPVDTIVCDEIHRARNFTARTTKSLIYASRKVRNFIGLTGSAVNNTPADIIPLMVAVTGQRFPIRDKSAFLQNFTRIVTQRNPDGTFSRVRVLKNTAVLKDLFKDHIYYLDTAMRRMDMPDKVVEWVPVRMSDYQKQLYEAVLGGLSPSLRRKIQRGEIVSQQEARSILNKILKARQISNSIAAVDKRVSLLESAEMTPKVRAVIHDVEQHLQNNPDGKALIFTNFLQGGADVLAAALSARKIPFGVFVGDDVPGGEYFGEKEREKAVEAYKKGKIRVLILSPAGAEGLDLPNTTFIAMFDPHYNPERILQQEARGVRIKGLQHRPPEKRKVIVRRYFTVVPRSFLQKILLKPREKSVEEWMYTLAANKAKLDREFREVMRYRFQNRPPTLLPAAPNVNIHALSKGLVRKRKEIKFLGKYETRLPGLGVKEEPKLVKEYLKEVPEFKLPRRMSVKDMEEILKIKKPRKPRSDKGKKRGKYRPRRPKSVIEMEKREKEMKRRVREQQRRLEQVAAQIS